MNSTWIVIDTNLYYQDYIHDVKYGNLVLNWKPGTDGRGFRNTKTSHNIDCVTRVGRWLEF